MRYKRYRIPEAFKIQGRESPGEGFFDEQGHFIPARSGEEVESFLPNPGVPDSVPDEQLVSYTRRLRTDSRYNVASRALPEIDRIWSVIKDEGAIWKTNMEDQKQAALDRFDDSRRGFQYVKREYVEDDDLYMFNSPSQEKRDFRLKLLRKIFRNHVPVKTTKEQLLYIIWLLTTDARK
jgi:hypothetical protein